MSEFEPCPYCGRAAILREPACGDRLIGWGPQYATCPQRVSPACPGSLVMVPPEAWNTRAACEHEFERLRRAANDWREDYKTLERMIVGDSGRSAAVEVMRLRKLDGSAFPDVRALKAEIERLREMNEGLMQAIRACAPPAEDKAEAVREAGAGLKRIIEEFSGAMEHGTWRDDHGRRLKDTPEWVAFYNALSEAGQ